MKRKPFNASDFQKRSEARREGADLTVSDTKLIGIEKARYKQKENHKDPVFRAKFEEQIAKKVQSPEWDKSLAKAADSRAKNPNWKKNAAEGARKAAKTESWQTNQQKAMDERGANNTEWRKNLREGAVAGKSSKTFRTPMGDFRPAKTALDAYGIPRGNTAWIHLKCIDFPTEFYYLDDEGERIVVEQRIKKKPGGATKVKTPLGIFDSIRDAIAAHGKKPSRSDWLYTQLKKFPDEFYKIDNDGNKI